MLTKQVQDRSILFFLSRERERRERMHAVVTISNDNPMLLIQIKEKEQEIGHWDQQNHCHRAPPQQQPLPPFMMAPQYPCLNIG